MANEFVIKNGFHSKDDSQVTGSLDVSGVLTAGGSVVGAAFPFTGDAQITGSLTISGSGISSPYYPAALKVDGGVYIVSGSNSGIVGLTIENTQAPTSTEAAGGAGIQMIGATGGSSPGVTGSIYVKDHTGGTNPYHPAMVLEAKDGGMYFTCDADTQEGSAFYFDKQQMSLNMDRISANEAEMSFMINNGGDSKARFVIGQSSNGYYFENSGKDDPFKIGYTTGDQGSGTYLDRILLISASAGSEVMQVGAESKDMNLSVSGSITSDNTASAEYFVGDGSNLTNVSAFPFTGDAQITGSLVISGSFSAFTLDSDDVVLGIEAGGTMIGAGYNVLVGRRAGGAISAGDYNVMIGNEAGYSGDKINSVAVGSLAGRGLTGTENVSLGHYSGYTAATTGAGKHNTFLGAYTGRNLTTGNGNVFVGHSAGYQGAANTGNIIIGSGSLGAPAYATPISNQLRIANSNHLTTISASLVTGETIVRSQRPITTHTVDFTASMDYIGQYNRVSGDLTCSILPTATYAVAMGAEFDFFQTSSAGYMLISGSGVTINSKNNNFNLAGQFSSATLKKVGSDEWDLMGDLT